MAEDAEGLLYPEVDASLCIDCQACVRLCPFHNPAKENKPQNVYAALNKNEKILEITSKKSNELDKITTDIKDNINNLKKSP